MWLEKPLAVSPQQEAVLQDHEREVAGLEARLKAERGHKGPRVAELAAELKRLKARGPVRETTLAVEELAAIVETRVNIRGSVHNLGEPVAARVPPGRHDRRAARRYRPPRAAVASWPNGSPAIKTR